jgi:hypothetical protein
MSGADRVGWDLPVQVDARGRIRLAADAAGVRAAMASVLGTVAGERVMRPELGVRPDWTAEELPRRLAELLESVDLDVSVTAVRVSPAWTVLGVLVHAEYVLRSSGELGQVEAVVPWTG